MSLAEKIDNPASWGRTPNDTRQKRIMHRNDRHQAKKALHKGEEPASMDHKYKGWTT